MLAVGSFMAEDTPVCSGPWSSQDEHTGIIVAQALLRVMAQIDDPSCCLALQALELLPRPLEACLPDTCLQAAQQIMLPSSAITDEARLAALCMCADSLLKPQLSILGYYALHGWSYQHLVSQDHVPDP